MTIREKLAKLVSGVVTDIQIISESEKFLLVTYSLCGGVAGVAEFRKV